MSDKDFLKFKNEQLSFSEFQQKLGKISEKDKQNLSKLLNIFDSDKNGLIETNNSIGVNEIKNLWDALKNAANKNPSGNNNELDSTELNIFGKEYLKEIDNAQNILTNFANTIFNKDEPVQTTETSNFKNNIDLTEIKAQNQVINTILDDVRTAGSLYFQQDNGKVSDAYDKLKEKDILGNKNLSATKVEEALALQEQTALNLISARDGELTKREYYLQNKEHLKTMLLRRIYEKDENTGLNFLDRNKGNRSKKEFAKFLEDYIEDKVNSIQEIDSIKTIQSRLISLEKEEMDKYLLNLLDGANNKKTKFQGIESRFSIDETIPPEFNSDDPITFEEVFRYERGVEYSKEKVEQLISKTQERQMSIGAFNKFQVYKNGVNELLKDSNSLTSDKIIEFYQAYYENSMNDNLAKEKLSELIAKSKLPISLIETNNGKINIDLSAISNEENKQRVLVNLLKLGLQEQEKLAVEVLGGKPEDRILAINQDYQAAYNSAYGSDFTEEIVKAMEEDNKTFIQKYTGEASTGGMVLIGLGAVLCCTPLAPAGGLILASGNALALGGMVAESGLGTYEAKTRDKVDEAELEDLKKTAIMNAGGFIVGFSAGKLGMKVFNKLVDKKLATIFKDKLSNIGRKEALKEVFTNPEMLKNFATAGGAKISTDFLISYAGDLVMMGILDPKDDWKSLLKSNLMGIMVGSASDIADVGKLAGKKKTNRANSELRQDNNFTTRIKTKNETEMRTNVAQNFKYFEKKLLETKLYCDDSPKMIKEYQARIREIAKTDFDLANIILERLTIEYSQNIDVILKSYNIDKDLTLSLLKETNKQNILKKYRKETPFFKYNSGEVILDIVEASQQDKNIAKRIINMGSRENQKALAGIIKLAYVDENLAKNLLLKNKRFYLSEHYEDLTKALKINKKLSMKLLSSDIEASRILNIVSAQKKSSSFIDSILEKYLIKGNYNEAIIISDVATIVNTFGADFAYKNIEELSISQKRKLLSEISSWKVAIGRDKEVDKIFPSIPAMKDSKKIATLINRLTKELNTKPNRYDESTISMFNSDLKKNQFSQFDINNVITKYLPEHTDINSEIVYNKLKQIMEENEFKNLSDKDKQITILSTFMSSKKTENASEFDIAQDMYNKMLQLGYSEHDAKKGFNIVKCSNAINNFMQTEKKNINHVYNKDFQISQRQNVINYLAFNLKESNTFNLAKLVYSSTEQKGLSRYLDKAIEQKIKEIKSDDFVLYQTSAEVYKQKAHKETIVRKDESYNVLVLNSSELGEFYAVVHNAAGISGLKGDRPDSQKYAKLKALSDIGNELAYCGAYITDSQMCLVGNDAFIFVVPNDKFYAAAGHDMGSRSKATTSVINEFMTNNNVTAETHNRSSQIETKKDERKMVSKNIKEILNITDEEYSIRIDKLKENLQGETLTPELLKKYDPELAQAYQIFYSRNNNNGMNGLKALLRDGEDKEWNEVVFSNGLLAAIVTRDINSLSKEQLQFAEQEGLPIVILNKKTIIL